MGALTYLRSDEGDLSPCSLIFGNLKYSKHICSQLELYKYTLEVQNYIGKITQRANLSENEKILSAHSHFLNKEIMYYLTQQKMPEKSNYFLILNHVLYSCIKRESGFILETHYKAVLLVHIREYYIGNQRIMRLFGPKETQQS